MYMHFLTSEGRPALLWRILFSLLILVFTLTFFFSAPDLLLAQLLHLSDRRDLYQFVDSFDIAGLLLPAYLLGGVFAVWCVCWLRKAIDHRPLAGLAFTPVSGHQRELLLGWFLGSFIPLAAICVAFFSGLLPFQPLAVTWPHILIALVFWSIGGLAGALRDEVVLRGYILQNLGERFPLWRAVLLLSVIGPLILGISQGFSVAWCVNLFLLSLIWTGTRLLTRSLWLGIGIHGGFNACSALLFSLILHTTPTTSLTSLLACLEIPFSVMLLVSLVAWMLCLHLRINWRQCLREEGQPPVMQAVPAHFP